jgi:hypothetical protein
MTHNANAPGFPALNHEYTDEEWRRFRGISTPWMTPNGAAMYLQLSIRGLEDMRARGTGPKFYKANRTVRYNIRDLDAWLQTNGGQHD